MKVRQLKADSLVARALAAVARAVYRHRIGFAVYAGLGVLARLMPQLQIFFVAVPLNIMCGFLIMLALLGSLMTVFLTYYANSMAIFVR